MNILVIPITLICAVLFGFLSRIIGSEKGEIAPKWFNPFKDWLYALPYGILGFLALIPTTGTLLTSYPWWVWAGLVVSFTTAFYGKRMSHGPYMDLGSWKGEYWSDFLRLSVTGGIVAVGASLMLTIGGYYIFAIALLVGGFMKAVAYTIGREFNLNVHTSLDEPTEVGELFTGFFGGLPLFFSIFYLLTS